MCPHSCQSRKQVLVLCELDLHLGICGLCPLREYVQNQVGPVKNPYVQLPFYVAELGRGELVIEYDYICLVFSDIFFDFLQLAASYVGPAVRLVHFLYEFFRALCPGRVRKEFELVQIFHYLAFIISLFDDTHEYCLFYVFLLSCHIPPLNSVQR